MTNEDEVGRVTKTLGDLGGPIDDHCMFLEAEVAELESEIDQMEQELGELRSFRRRVAGAFELFSSLLEERDRNLIPGLSLDNCEDCRSTHGIIGALSAVLAPRNQTPVFP
jgi:hypothetical protein